MLLTERRKRYRQYLQGTTCLHPASVYDAMSARIAASLGFEIGMFAGSTGSATVVGAPDLIVLTLTEFADQIRRIARSCDLPLMVDADHGYGNALNVMRTVEELEISGVCGMTIEDTVLPTPFGAKGESLISLEEMVGKLRAAVAARQDKELVLIGRTSALKNGGMAELEKRVRAYQETGVDAIFLLGVQSKEELAKIRGFCRLPMILGSVAGELTDRKLLAEHGVRIALQGHQPLYAGVKAVYETMKHLREGGSTAALKDKVASEELLDIALRQKTYKRWQQDFLK